MSAPRRARVAVLASGGGSNLGALLDHAATLGEARAFDVALVVTNAPTAGALDRAARAGIARHLLARHDDAAELHAALEASGAELVVLAGYLKLVPAEVTRRFPGRMLNVHPALLPAFGGHGMYGMRVHRAVLAAGARVSGPTVHFVDEQYDRGPIVAQWPVPVSSLDSAESLAARVLRAEHALLPRVVQAVARGDVALAADGTVRGAFALPPDAPPFTLDADGVADAIDRALRPPV